MKKKINMQFIIVSFIAIILTMSLSVGTFYELFVQEMRNDMKAYTHVLRSAGVFNASNEEKLNLKNEDLRITIIDADGTVVYDNEANDIEMDNHKDRPEIESALKMVRAQMLENLQLLIRAHIIMQYFWMMDRF